VNLPLRALQEQRPDNSERERDTCGSSCVPATWFGSGRERRGDRKLAAHSHQGAGTTSIPPHSHFATKLIVDWAKDNPDKAETVKVIIGKDKVPLTEAVNRI
jgi:hypothetical protein